MACLSQIDVPQHRQPLIDYLACLPEHEIGILFNILDVANHALIFESTDENLIFQEFMTTLFIAAKANKIFK